MKILVGISILVAGFITVLIIAAVGQWLLPVANAQAPNSNFNEQGGLRTQIGGSIDIVSGGEIDVESGGALKLAGTTVTSSAAELNIVDGVTATAAEINAVADNSANHEVVTTTNVITATETGKHFIINSATAFVSTLPAPALGLEFWFHAGATQVTGGNHTVVTNSSANVIEGSITSPEVSALVAVVAAADTISFVADLAVHGDFVHVWSDGTTWYIHGMTFVQDGMTTTQAS